MQGDERPESVLMTGLHATAERRCGSYRERGFEFNHFVLIRCSDRGEWRAAGDLPATREQLG